MEFGAETSVGVGFPLILYLRQREHSARKAWSLNVRIGLNSKKMVPFCHRKCAGSLDSLPDSKIHTGPRNLHHFRPLAFCLRRIEACCQSTSACVTQAGIKDDMD